MSRDQVPRVGGVRKGWIKQYVILCSYKLLFYDEDPERRDQPSTVTKTILDIWWVLENISLCSYYVFWTIISYRTASQLSRWSLQNISLCLTTLSRSDPGFQCQTVLPADVIHATQGVVPLIFKVSQTLIAEPSKPFQVRPISFIPSLDLDPYLYSVTRYFLVFNLRSSQMLVLCRDEPEKKAWVRTINEVRGRIPAVSPLAFKPVVLYNTNQVEKCFQSTDPGSGDYTNRTVIVF